MNKKEFEIEQNYLNNTIKIVETKIDEINIDMLKYEDEYDSHQEFLIKNTNLSKGEIINVNLRQNRLSEKINEDYKQYLSYKKVLKNPYFAKIVIDNNNEQFYIGIKNIEQNDKIYAIDWRVPICSLFYDSDLGNTSYISPQGKIDVNLKLKRQFKIEDGCLIYLYDRESQINDDILLESLSNNSSSFMKNIVATIQGEQNVIIRETPNVSIVVNGIAAAPFNGVNTSGMSRSISSPP